MFKSTKLVFLMKGRIELYKETNTQTTTIDLRTILSVYLFSLLILIHLYLTVIDKRQTLKLNRKYCPYSHRHHLCFLEFATLK